MKFYEVAIKDPSFSALYLHDNQLNYQTVPRLSIERVQGLARDLNLPLNVFKNLRELF